MSYTNLKYHIVFSTKQRRPLIESTLLPRLQEYVGGIVRELDGKLLEANGPEDHMHLCIQAKPTIAVSDLVGKIKANSSGWVHKTFPHLRDFAWQDGYAAFTVAQSGLSILSKYIHAQQEHHKKQSFQEELIALLKLHGIDYDERYIFV